ncbi:endoplasmic reticulum lectin 1 [Aplysia californica]|uniref:Endoplasmic reticulum lectin 1 n=1 Tax=Aplysia californica TaxID=6500 RepID=A0ABM0K1D8_APLCA|nr:endoplasmic reticulum lectin 1 [Aplysia californica]
MQLFVFSSTGTGMAVLFLFMMKLSLLIYCRAESSFDPFMDTNLFLINWAGPLELNKEEVESLGERHVMITTNHQEKYRCILPETKNLLEADAASYSGPSADELLEPLMQATHCSYRIESYWTYELCHGKHLKQYHEAKEQGMAPKLQEYYLGYGNHREDLKKNDPEKLKEDPEAPRPVRDLEGTELPYFEIIMDGGTKCDLTGTPRKAHVLYVCQPEGRGEVYELKESSTCEYEVVVLTSLLCSHPSYRPKTPPVSEIRCYSMLGSPLKPREVYKVDLEANYLQQSAQNFKTAHQVPEPRESRLVRKRKDPPVPTEPKLTAQKQPEHKLGVVTDKQTLRAFLNGGHCLAGGTGWWKHEVCFGRFAKQFHMEKGVETKVFLGYWNKEKHIAWLKDNPLKRPKDPEQRRMLSYFYTGGDWCDLTNKPRTCEVRLKCLQNVQNPHAVVLSLAEPVTCQYVLTVESALFCPVLKDADDNGLFDSMDL